MASTSPFRVVLLVWWSVLLTAALGFGLPAALRLLAGGCGLAERSLPEVIVGVYLVFVAYVAMPRLPRGVVEVRDKAVFITGCDRGFGKALAKHLHTLGFTVFAGCLLKDAGGEGARELEELGCPRMKVLQLDVCSEEQVHHAVEYLQDNLADKAKGLWALVNNAGVSTFGEVEFTSMDAYKQVSEVNLWGTIRVTKAVLPLHGVEVFSDCLRHEMRPWGVKVSVVEPGGPTAAARDIASRAANRMWLEAPAGVKGRKAHFDRQVAPMLSGRTAAGGRDVGPALADVEDAVWSRRPYARYNPMEPRWWIRMQLVTHLPAALSDRLIF
ncbi:hypothetical protein NHX12_026475 [Muraenolepis orangiensis]|uniref:Uncharacterized protein n=1 Tax=Muraenolepis orangiensis TaxID=630683 RepID=A0A9Q0EHF8_9TELE|nr:hypothetical protein NHX12_026475 [Muraenolepis orangiensis]